jgi:hypothetical protein
LPNALLQLSEYFFVEPLRVIVISDSFKNCLNLEFFISEAPWFVHFET